MPDNLPKESNDILYEFRDGPNDGIERFLPRWPEGHEYYLTRPPFEGPVIRDERGRDNMREFTYRVHYDPDTGQPLLVWQGEK
jgi:hypothetical protein